MKDSIERWLGTLFGLIFVALSLVVAVETLVRKVFNFSLQGADELGGYALAFGATIAFSLALMGKSHMWWCGRCGGGRYCSAGDGPGWWRIDPSAGFARWRRRPEAVAECLASPACVAEPAARFRSDRPIGAHRC